MNRSLVFCLLALLPELLVAHESPSHNLKQLERHLAETPDDPELLRQKAALLLNRHPKMAAKVVAKLMRIAPENPDNRLLQAQVDALLGEPAQALDEANSLVAAHPKFFPAWNFLAGLHEAVGRRDEAIAAKLRYLELVPKPDPSDVLACAGWLRDRGQPGDPEAAVRVLDRGLSRLGCLTGLHEMAIGIELANGGTDSALRRVDVLEARYRPTVALSLRRADILEKAGRHPEAAAACDSALALLDLAPPARRKTAAFKEQFDAVGQRKSENLAKASNG